MSDTASDIPIHGEVAAGFDQVRAAFEANFHEREELGAACAAWADGEKVVDLWGGWCDPERTRPWAEDTIVLVFSTGKGLAAMTLAVALARGWLELDVPVAKWWPEFAQAGKEDITVRQLLAHEAGMAALDVPITPELLGNREQLAEALARQSPAWEPGRHHGYHAFTIGLYESELMHRADPQKRSCGEVFRDEIAGPLGLTFHFGLPPDVPAARISPIQGFHLAQMYRHLDTLSVGMLLRMLLPWSVPGRVLRNPKVSGPADYDRPEWRAVEFTNATGMGEVRAVARAYGALASGGQELGLDPDTMAALIAPANTPPGGSLDLVLRTETRFSMGFLRPSPSWRFGTSDRAFGFAGAGGSVGFADPDSGLGFAYAPNRMGFHMFGDPRAVALYEACCNCAGAR
jgi:CubicO group peptidase (beta-lactamase class C family)